MQLRDYQQNAVSEVASAHRAGHAGVLLVVPTGGGKTVIFVRIAAGLAAVGAGVLIVVPAIELLEQTRDKLKRFGVRHGVIAAGYARNPDPGAPIQVAMVQTLRSRPGALLFAPNYIIFDEAHLSAADSYQLILSRYPDARYLGVTATPFRLDGAGFDFATALVEGPRPQRMIADRYLVPFRTYSVPLSELAACGRRRREFEKSKVADAYNKRQLIGDVVGHFRRLAHDRSALVFASSIEHSRAMCAAFRAAGYNAEHVDGTTPADARAAILARLESGATQVVCNYGVLTAGFDCPRVSAVVIVRPTASLALWIQMAGRGLRLCPEIGKVDCVIIDHGGNAMRHGNVDYPHVYSLTGRDRAANDDDVTGIGRECPQCFLVVDATVTECPQCQFDLTTAAAAAARGRKKPESPIDVELELVAGGAAPIDLDALAAKTAAQVANAARHSRAAKLARAHSFAAGFAAAGGRQ